MARQNRSQYVYFRHEGSETREVFFRINPLAIRVQQGNKGSIVDTLGGYFREVFYSQDRQYSGLLLPDLVIEGETGIGYRRELKIIDWIWRNHGAPKPDGSPADTYFFDLIQVGPFQDIERDEIKAYLIEISHFAWDETVQDPYRIRFVFRAKILRDFNWDGQGFNNSSGGIVGGELGQLPRLGAGLNQLSSLIQTVRQQIEQEGIRISDLNLDPLRRQVEQMQPLLQGSLAPLQQTLGSLPALPNLQTVLRQAENDLHVAELRLEKLLGLTHVRP